MAHIVQIEPRARKQARQFLELPFRLYKNIPQWVPMLEIDSRRMLDRKRHPFYRDSQAAFFLAYTDKSEPVGRIAVLDNRRYNTYRGENTAFFYLFECEAESGTSKALLRAAFDWACARGLEKISGPRGFSVLDGMGLLVRGFEHRPALGQPYNPAYYQELIEAEGFHAVSEIVSGYLDASAPFPEHLLRMSELVQKRRGLHIATVQKRSDLRALIPKLKDLYNGALEGTSGTYPLTDDEVQSMADQILWFADPRLIKVILKGEEPVGFLLAYPDISAALQRTRGKLFPFGWLDILRELRSTTWINVNGAGILEQYRGLGGTAILFAEMYQSVAQSRYLQADLVQIGAENDRMMRELRELGINFYKAHRIYERNL